MEDNKDINFVNPVIKQLKGAFVMYDFSIGVLLVVGFMLLVRLSRMTRAAEHAA